MEGVQDSVGRAQGCKELGCTAQGCRVPAVAAVVHTRVVLPEAVSSSRLVAVVRIVAVDHIAATAVHIAVVVQATGNHRREDRATACSAAFRVGAVLGMESSVVAELAQQTRRRQLDVLREACRGRVKSRNWSQMVLSALPVVEVPGWCGVVDTCVGKAKQDQEAE